MSKPEPSLIFRSFSDHAQNFQEQLKPLTSGNTVTIAIPAHIQTLVDLESLIEDIKEAATCLLPTHNIRIGIGNGKISISTRKFGSNSWEENYRK
jgi:hypothetical protein